MSGGFEDLFLDEDDFLLDFAPEQADAQTASAPRGKRARAGASSNTTSTAQLEAQKRWRERQKKRAQDLEAELAAKAQQYQQLMQTNGYLSRKLKILESVLVVREQHLGALSKATPAGTAAAGGAPAGLPSASPAAGEEQHLDQGAHASNVQQGPGEGDAVLSGAATLQVTSQGAAALHHSLLVLAQQGQQQHEPDPPLPSNREVAAQVPPPPPLDQQITSLRCIPPAHLWDPAWVERLKHVTARELQTLWLEFIRESSMFVIGAEAHGPTSRAHQQLAELVPMWLGVLDQLTAINPTCYVNSLYVNIATGQREAPPQHHWRNVARAVVTTEAQVKEAVAALAVFDEAMEAVMAERASLAAQLQHVHALPSSQTPWPGSTQAPLLAAPPVPVPPLLPSVATAAAISAAAALAGGDVQAALAALQSSSSAGGHHHHGAPRHESSSGGTSTGGSSRHSHGAAVVVDDIADQLQKNIHRELAAHNLVSDYLVTRVLSPVQVARAVAASYPLLPDVTAILREGVRLLETGSLPIANDTDAAGSNKTGAPGGAG